MKGQSGQRGQTAIEWLGVLLVVALLVATVGQRRAADRQRGGNRGLRGDRRRRRRRWLRGRSGDGDRG